MWGKTTTSLNGSSGNTVGSEGKKSDFDMSAFQVVNGSIR
jgi:hypothetical protein